jgi:hypothetical protein
LMHHPFVGIFLSKYQSWNISCHAWSRQKRKRQVQLSSASESGFTQQIA